MSGVVVRPLAERDFGAADRINRIAFGTFFGLEDPASFRGDGDVVPGRYRANPAGAFAAELDGRLVACGFVMDWGSVGILGPITVDVELWSRGIARALMPAMLEYMDAAEFSVQGLFTHPQSARHIRLYESFGFRMQRITGVMDREPDPATAEFGHAALYSSLTDAAKDVALAACREMAGTICPGMDLTREIASIDTEGFGDTVLLQRDHRIVGFACCHHGRGSEAGSAQVMVKFAAVECGTAAAGDFRDMLAACEAFALQRGVARLVAGTNTGRTEAYEIMLDYGFRTWMNGIAMLRPDRPGYNRPGVYVIDDWR